MQDLSPLAALVIAGVAFAVLIVGNIWSRSADRRERDGAKAHRDEPDVDPLDEADLRAPTRPAPVHRTARLPAPPTAKPVPADTMREAVLDAGASLKRRKRKRKR